MFIPSKYLWVPFILAGANGAAIAYTAVLNAETEGFKSGITALRTLVDLRPFAECRFAATILTANSSANTPRMYLKYSTAAAFSSTSFLALGGSDTSPVLSLTSLATLLTTGWFKIDPAARIESCYVSVFSKGGDGSQNSGFGRLYAEFR